MERLSKFFCRLLIFRCSIKKLLLSKLFQFREDSSGVNIVNIKIKSVKEIFIWILTIIIQYILEIEGSEYCRFEICLPGVNILFGNPCRNVRVTKKKCVKKKQSLTKKPGFVPYKLQFYIASKKSYHPFNFLVLLSLFFFLILAVSLLKFSKIEKLVPFSFLQFLEIPNLFL